MKNISRTLFLSLFLMVGLNTVQAQAPIFPDKTVFLKHPDAANLEKFFTENVSFRIDIYKSGSTADLQKLLGLLRKDKAIESCVEGTAMGDYLPLNVSLKKPVNKIWFKNWLKSAGLKHLRVNNDPVKEVDKI